MFPENLDMVSEYLELDNRLEELIRLMQWVGSLCEQHEIHPKTRFSMELVLEEAVTNVYSYAYESHDEQKVGVRIDIDTDIVSITVHDDGREFNPLSISEPDMPHSIEDAHIGGLGVHLIRTYTKMADYFRNEERNHLVMVLER